MEKEEFKRLWLPLCDDFYRTACSILGSEADAKDAVQDLYIRLWNSRDSLGNIRSPMAYGNRIVRNICIDRLRSAAARRETDETAEECAAFISGDNAEKRIIDKETLRSLKDAMETLPENCRTAVRLRFFEQMEYDEIARNTGFSAINVRVLISRGKKMLRKAMEDKNPKIRKA